MKSTDIRIESATHQYEDFLYRTPIKFGGAVLDRVTLVNVECSVRTVGGKPANFCDLGGGGNAQGVVDALEVITRDPQVKSIFFNIFGGITRCDEVARGILEALERLDMSTYPIVVRLDGTNAQEGRKILADAGKPNIYPEATMLDGAKRAVELAR